MALTNVLTDAEGTRLVAPMPVSDAVLHLQELMSRGIKNWEETIRENPVAYLSALKCYSEYPPSLRRNVFGKDVDKFQEDNYLNRWRSLGI